MKWSERELERHLKAAEKISQLKDEAFKLISEKAKGKNNLTDYEVQQYILKRFKDLNLVSDVSPPIVAVNKNSSDPHYTPSKKKQTKIQKGSWVLIDIWAKEKEKNGIFADITWVGYVGDKVPEKYQRVFGVVVKARGTALQFLERKLKKGEKVLGWEVDKVARETIKKAGYGKYFSHSLGHNLGYKVHADTVSLKSLFSKNVFVDGGEIRVTAPVQDKIVLL